MYRNTIFVLSKKDSLFLKGVGIILIMFHNYLHLLDGAMLENELIYYPERAERFLCFIRNIFYTEILESISNLFSYWGHYGVVLFVFVSGYGLSVKYGQQKNSLHFRSFILPKLIQFWKLMLPILVLLILASSLKRSLEEGTVEVNKMFVFDSLLMATFVSNLILGKEFIISGPWWFFSLIVQLYLCYLILVRMNDRGIFKMLCLALVVQAFAMYYYPDYLFRLRFNFIGWLPEFCLGILAGRNPHFRVPSWVFVLFLVLFIGGNYNSYLWLFSGICVIFIVLGIYQWLKQKVKRCLWVDRFILFLGRYSFYLFITHSFVRVAIEIFSHEFPSFYFHGPLFYFFIAIGVAVAYKYILDWFYPTMENVLRKSIKVGK